MENKMILVILAILIISAIGIGTWQMAIVPSPFEEMKDPATDIAVTCSEDQDCIDWLTDKGATSEWLGTVDLSCSNSACYIR